MPKPAPLALSFWLGLFLFALYLLSFSGKFHVMDELAVYTAGHSLARHGRADINPLIWTNHWTPNPPGIWGQDDQLYTKKAPGISFMVAPLVWLGHALPGLNAVHVGLLTNSLVTALTAAVLLLWLTDLGFDRRASLLTTLAYGLGTIAWVYARMFWESSPLALFLLLAVWAACRATASFENTPLNPPAGERLAGGRSASFGLVWLLVSGLAVAVSITLRFEAIVAAMMIGLYLLWPPLRPSPSPPHHASLRFCSGQARLTQHAAFVTFKRLTIYTAPIILISLGLVAFNLARFGSAGETGYSRELLFRAPWVGSYGLLFSPGRGLFLYSPLLLLLFFGIRPVWRRLPRAYFWLIAGLCLFYWLFYGAWFAWGGTWGWGPRFLLPILPLLLLFVAPPLAWAFGEVAFSALTDKRQIVYLTLARAGIVILAAASLGVNLLGLAVDFNEHFLRLGRNDDFVFNWSAFPPLGHWFILREGLFDLIWLQATPAGLALNWAVAGPALVLLALAAAGLGVQVTGYRLQISGDRGQDKACRTSGQDIMRYGVVIGLTLVLVYLMMRATAQAPQQTEQARYDQPLLAALAGQSQPGDVLLTPMYPFGDVQEITTYLLAYLEPALPTWAWIETPPRAVDAEERQRILSAAQAGANRLWLFERWLTQSDPAWPTTVWLNQHAFPLETRWFERSGRLTLYALPRGPEPPPTPLAVRFQGGLTLADFALFDGPPQPGSVLKLRLTWQLAPVEALAGQQLPVEPVMASVQLLDESGQRLVAQNDRLLLDLQQFEQSPLLPGQTTPQGYGLHLPPDLAPGAYPLIVSLYRAGAGQRLPRADGSGDDFLYLTTVTLP